MNFLLQSKIVEEFLLFTNLTSLDCMVYLV